MTSEQPHPRPDETATSRQPGWVDRLVELHVLAENGDTAAAAEAGTWIGSDSEARRVWDDVARTCDQLRAQPADE
jgi:hypothetical protein